MKPFRIISRNIRDAFKSVFRNFSLSLAAISAITITLIVVSLSMILSYNVNNFTDLAQKGVTIVTFLDVDIDEDGILTVEDQINRIDNVKSYTFDSKEEIAERMAETSPELKNVIKKWEEGENPLQSTFLVKVSDITKIGEVATEIEKIEGVELTKYGKGMVEQLVEIFDVVEKASIILVIALVLVTAFLISNTIKITIFSRKREIEIMRLVGASNINIKIPFIIEGLILGFLGAIVPIAFTIYGYNTAYTNFNGQSISPFIKLVEPEPFIFYVSLVLLGISMLVGMFGSVRAVRKHLKI